MLRTIFRQNGYHLRLGAVLALAFAASSAGAHMATGEVMKAPGSRVAIDLPRNYEVSRLFHGFILRAASISVVLFEVPGGASPKLAEGLTPAALEGKRIKNARKADLGRGDEHLYLVGEQESNRGTIIKHILLIRNKDHAALITANVPKASIDGGLISKDEIPKALATAVVQNERAPSNDPYKLGYLGRFKEAGPLRASAKLYTEDGLVIPAKPGAVRNAVIVAPSINQLPVADVKAFAKRAWGSLSGYEGLTIKNEAPVSAGGLEGHQISGEGTRSTPDGAVPVFLRQVLLKRKGGGYFRIIMIGKSAEAAVLNPEFDKIVAGFALSGG